MANVDRATLKANYQAVTDRTPPYDAEPLIQKEDQQATIGDDFMDSALVKLPNVGSINSPSAAFNVDFDFSNGIDRYDIDTTGSVDAAFTITLQGLSDNQTGILNITKKANDTISFANGLITPFNNTEGQVGQTSIVLFVKVINSNYIISSGYQQIKAVSSIDQSQSFKVVKIDIGPWDMNTTSVITVSYPAIDVTKVVSIKAIIINDEQDRSLPSETPESTSGSSSDLLSGCAIRIIGPTSCSLIRRSGSIFESNRSGTPSFTFSSVLNNRGYIYITLEQ